MSRSGHVCAHSAPIAPAWNFCSKIVHTLATADINANGASATTSRQRIRLVRHQIHRASTTGNMTTEGLLKVASTKRSKEKANIEERPFPRRAIALRRRPNRRWDALETAPPCFLISAIHVIRVIRGGSCHFKKQRMDKR